MNEFLFAVLATLTVIITFRLIVFSVARQRITKDLLINSYEFLRLVSAYETFRYNSDRPSIRFIIRPKLPIVYFRELHFIGADGKEEKMLVAIEVDIGSMKIFYQKDVIFKS
ncbi:hypothetical protein SAMN05444266_101369 [Chitinophaga jiangningensis]|uniref:Uncharacterized protein n=1 Tax=Chitinophaga jiangningensis TaxID=1419482 RepID=A0A1M6VUW7_9BACT|nr:hypothetical protein SAMN05444266_101369 [Chitinophaga jiangningensis]